MSVPLNTGGSVTLDALGNGTVILTPNSGPPTWNVTKVTVFTSRPGLAPVPRFTLYLGDTVPNDVLGITYDGSFDESDLSVSVTRGQNLIGVWSGGQSGDLATMSIYGEKVL